MLWTRADGGVPLRLAYCLNLHPAEDLDGVLGGLRTITLPLRERVAPGLPFGVGLYLGAALAHELASDAGRAGRERLAEFLGEHALDPFTFNAFPFGGFHAEGLKERVFQPAWDQPERLAYTLAVARIAAEFGSPGSHVSISTHTGFFGSPSGSAGGRREEACARNLLRAVGELVRIEAETGRRIVLSLEPEPGANRGRTAALAEFRGALRARAAELAPELAAPEEAVTRHLGTCLDACHAAVEFEEPDVALRAAVEGGAPLGKLQFTSALALRDPRGNEAGRRRLFALDEPRYLHQVRARTADGRLEAADLPELRDALADPRSPWWGVDEWRCHFHVPVDLVALGDAPREAGGLGTTRAAADALLAALLDDAVPLGVEERHVEIETYTWDVLPDFSGAPDDLVAGLEREYGHVARLLRAASLLPATRS